MYILCWRYAREHYLYTKYGGYAVVEIKLGYKEVEDAKKNLLSLYNNMIKKQNLCVLLLDLQIL